MIVLVSGATKTFRRYAGHPLFGHLKTPRSGNCLSAIVASACPWAADNDCFQRLDVEAYWSMLAAISRVDRSRLLWVAAPDIVGDAQGTINRWVEWWPQLDYLGLPVAFVGQDGLEDIPDQIPWDEMAAFFVGGSTAWKLGRAAEDFCREARARGKWVHVGRVNTARRIRHAFEIGANSIDGTAFSRWPDKYFPKALQWINNLQHQPSLFSTRPPEHPRRNSQVLHHGASPVRSCWPSWPTSTP